MWPDRVSNPGPLTYESGALPTVLGGPAYSVIKGLNVHCQMQTQTAHPNLIKAYLYTHNS